MNVPKWLVPIRARVNAMSGLTLGWLSFAAAVVGGTAAVTTFPGSIIKNVASVLPYHAGIAIAVVLTLMGIADLWRDLIPNRFAVTAAALAPSLWQVVGGKAGNAAHGWTAHINTWAQNNMLKMLGEGSIGAVAVLCLAAAFILAHKAAPKLHARAEAAKNAVQQAQQARPTPAGR